MTCFEIEDLRRRVQLAASRNENVTLRAEVVLDLFKEMDYLNDTQASLESELDGEVSSELEAALGDIADLEVEVKSLQDIIEGFEDQR